MTSRIAFLGTGLMGLPMSANLLRAGFALTAWNRTLSKAEPLRGLGGTIAGSASEAVAGADVVCLMLENGPVVEAVLLASDVVDALTPGAVIVDFSSIAPWMAKENARRLAEHSVHYLDAPVSGGPYGAEAGSLAIMVGGADEAVSKVGGILQRLGTATHVGPSGCGQIAKLGSQIIVASAISAVAEALLLARSSGADPAKVRRALTGGFADSKILQIHAQRMLERDFVPGGHVRTHSKDLDAALKTAEETGLALPMTSFVQDAFRKLCERGLGDCDHSALVLALEAENKSLRLSEAADKLPPGAAVDRPADAGVPLK